MPYEFISDHEVRLEARRLLEQEHAKAYFALLAEPDPTKLKALQAELDAAQARIANLGGSEEERLEEISAIVNAPEPVAPKKKWFR